jgi:hypothetical protein
VYPRKLVVSFELRVGELPATMRRALVHAATTPSPLASSLSLSTAIDGVVPKAAVNTDSMPPSPADGGTGVERVASATDDDDGGGVVHVEVTVHQDLNFLGANYVEHRVAGGANGKLTYVSALHRRDVDQCHYAGHVTRIFRRNDNGDDDDVVDSREWRDGRHSVRLSACGTGFHAHIRLDGDEYLLEPVPLPMDGVRRGREVRHRRHRIDEADDDEEDDKIDNYGKDRVYRRRRPLTPLLERHDALHAVTPLHAHVAAANAATGVVGSGCGVCGGAHHEHEHEHGHAHAHSAGEDGNAHAQCHGASAPPPPHPLARTHNDDDDDDDDDDDKNIDDDGNGGADVSTASPQTTSPPLSPPASPLHAAIRAGLATAEKQRRKEEQRTGLKRTTTTTQSKSKAKRRLLQQTSIVVEFLTVNDYTRYNDKRADTETDAAVTMNLVNNLYDAAHLGDSATVIRLVAQHTFIDPDNDVIEPKQAATAQDTWETLQPEFDPDTRLRAFTLGWYSNTFNSLVRHDSIQLFTGVKFSGGRIGYAFVNTICSPSTASTGTVSTYDRSAAQNVVISAHELGHSFGSNHDGNPAGTSGSCNPQGFLMSSSAVLNTEWSQCSKDVLAAKYADAPASDCLRNGADDPEWDDAARAVCRDGFVSYNAGEECDCGAADCSVLDPCCDGTTCRLKAGQDCSSKDVCCDNSCKFESANTVCRQVAGECDIIDFCTGTTGICPTDAVKGHGHECQDSSGNNNGRCYAGACKTITAQCQRIGNSTFRECTQPPSFYDVTLDTVCDKLRCEETLNPGKGCFSFLPFLNAFWTVEDGMTCDLTPQVDPADWRVCEQKQCVLASSL